MDSLNTIPNSGSFGDVSAKLNDNFSKVGQSLTTLENTRFDSAYSVYVETTTDNPVKTKEEWADSLRVEILVDKDQFAKNTSTSFPPSVYQDTVPVISAGEYLWVRRYTSFTDGTITTSVPRVWMGDVAAISTKLDKDAIFTLPSKLYASKAWSFALNSTLVYYDKLCKFTKDQDFTCYLKMSTITTNVEVRFFQIVNSVITELHTQTFSGVTIKSFNKSEVTYDFSSTDGYIYIGLSAAGGYALNGNNENSFYYNKTTKAVTPYGHDIAYWIEIGINKQYDEIIQTLKEFGDLANAELLSASGYDATALIDDFSTTKDWTGNPTYPMPFTISGGVLSFTTTADTHQGIRIALKNTAIGLLTTIKIRIRKTTSNLSIVDIGYGWGGANYTSQSDPYRTFLPSQLTNVFQEFEYRVTSTALVYSFFEIGFHSTKNKGDTYEIEFVSVNEGKVGYNTKTVEILNDIKTTVSELGGSTGYDLQAIVEANNGGTINLKAGLYETSIPLHSYINSGTKILGNQNVIIKYDGTGSFFDPVGKQDITLDGFSLQGNQAILPAAMTVADVKAKTGIGTVNGIYASGICHNIRIKDLTIFNFSGIGIGGANTHQLYSKTIKISGCLVYNCYLGLFMNVRSEYHEIFGNQFCYNRINGWIDGGNNFGAVNQFNGGGVGLVLYGSGNNDTHGSMGNCSFNHNISYGLMSIGINNGYTFTGCHLFDGKLYIENSSGFSFTGGELAGEIECVTDKGFNIIANNIFFKTYGGGTITGSPTNLSMNGNRFIDGSDSSTINNSI